MINSSILTFYSIRKLAIFFLFFWGISAHSNDSFFKVSENANYRFISNQSSSISINKKTKSYIFSAGKADIQFLSKNLFQIRVNGKKGFYFFNFNISDKQKLNYVNYNLISYKDYSSNCSLASGNSTIKKNLEQFSNLDDSIRKLAQGELVFDKDSCSSVAEEYQPKMSEKRTVLDQFTFRKSDLMKCVDSELVQNQVKNNSEISRVFNNIHNQFGKIFSSIENGKDGLKVSCSSSESEAAKIKFTENGIQILINFKKTGGLENIQKYISHELIHAGSINQSKNSTNETNDSNINLTRQVECICQKYDDIQSINNCIKSDSKTLSLGNEIVKANSSSQAGTIGSSVTDQNLNATTHQAIQNSPAVQNFRPVEQSTIATLANSTLQTPTATTVAAGYSGNILPQPSFDSAANAVAKSLGPLINTVSASISRLEAQTDFTATPTTSSSNSSTPVSQAKTPTATSAASVSAGAAVAAGSVSGGADSSPSTASAGSAALATGLQAAAKMASTPSGASASGETAGTVNSKMASGSATVSNGGAAASSGRSVDAGSAETAGGGGSASSSATASNSGVVRQPANTAGNTFTPARAVLTLNTLSKVSGNTYEAIKGYYADTNFKDGLRINGIQVQAGSQKLGAQQKPKKVFVDDGKTLELQKTQ